jgi:hypothetical protein
MSRLNSLKKTLVTVVVLAMFAGCAPLKIPKPNVWPFATEDPPGTPARIVASWTDTVLYQPNQVPLRGFGGRFIFYSGDNKPEPIKVEGTLTVYVFDETNRDPNNLKPDRKYVFTKEQLPSHYSKSKLGHSYSVWLPWDETGGPQKEVSLIARFTPEKGNVVVGEQTKQILPGRPQIIAKNPADGALPAPASQATSPLYSCRQTAVQPASYVTPLPPVDYQRQTAQPNLPAQSPGVNTTTISLPPQSSLKNSMLTGNAAYTPTGNATMTAPVVDPKYVTRTGVINPAAPNLGQNPPARYSDTVAFNPGFTAANQAYQPVSQPNRFVPGRPQAPNAPISLPNRGPGPWLQPQSTQQFVPDTTPQPSTVNDYPSSSLKAGLIQN